MQTYLPDISFIGSASCLDRQRLGKQRIEVYQILSFLAYGGGWERHPAVSMWRGGEGGLIVYGGAICHEWSSRGYTDIMWPRIAAFAEVFDLEAWPLWLGDPAFHSAHRATLLAKSPEWYSQWGWAERPSINHIWPSGQAEAAFLPQEP